MHVLFKSTNILRWIHSCISCTQKVFEEQKKKIADSNITLFWVNQIWSFWIASIIIRWLFCEMSFIKRIVSWPYEFIQYPTSTWNAKTPLGKRNSLYNFVKWWGTILQMEMFTGRPNGPIIFMIAFSALISYSLLIYTTYFYINAGEFSKCIPCYSMLGYTLSVSSC